MNSIAERPLRSDLSAPDAVTTESRTVRGYSGDRSERVRRRGGHWADEKFFRGDCARRRALALFFSHGVSLETWDRNGMFAREVGYYQALEKYWGPLLFVSYDVPKPGLADRLRRVRPIAVAYNRWRLPYPAFGFLAPLLLRKLLRQCAIFKSNQLSGSWTAVIAARMLRKPLIVRCGFVPSLFERHAGGKPKWYRMLLERFAVRAANVVVVATEDDMEYLAATHGVARERFRVIPNPIDTRSFCPRADIARVPNSVLFVGRFVPQKNLSLLLEAISRIPEARLMLIGAGPLEAQLRQLAPSANVTFAGQVANTDLPRYLASAEIFVLPSGYEGCPKALLEAMACGAAVVGTDVPGIRGVIQHEVNGLLCAATCDDLVSVLRRLLSDSLLRRRLGEAAARFIVDNYSQEAVLRKELDVLNKLLGASKEG